MLNTNNKIIKIGIIGSRDYSCYMCFKEKLQTILEIIKKENKNYDYMFVSGGARGIDSFANDFAKEFGISILIHYPNWNLYGKKAGFIRNDLIVNSSDFFIIFWDGVSKGTEDSIKKIKKLNKKFVLVDI